MKSVSEGELTITKEFVDEMNFCLDCQACETACPAGVEYGKLVESARIQIFQARRESRLTRILKRALLRTLFWKHKRFVFASALLRLYQRSPINRLLKRTGALRILSERLHKLQFLTPTISEIPSSKLLPERLLPIVKPRYKVGFLTGCIMDVAFAETNVDTVRVLVHHGCEVIIPPHLGCCGSLQAHGGDIETARKLAREVVDAFSGTELDAIVMNSAGCGAFMKQYGEVLADDPAYAAPAAQLAAKVRDLSEFLIDTGFKIRQPAGQPYRSKRVTYHDACHLVHAQKISQQPRNLIKSIPSLEFVELPEASWCCGSAGTYNITHDSTATQLLHRKLGNIKAIKPDIIVTSNPGCLIQLQHGLDEQGLDIELLHLATFLRRACEA